MALNAGLKRRRLLGWSVTDGGALRVMLGVHLKIGGHLD